MKRLPCQSALSFRLMSLEFHLRDWLRPPVKILKAAGLRDGMTVMDYGCGPGGFSLAAAGIVGEKGRVYALDIHPLAIESVRRAALGRNMENILVMDADGANDLPDRCIDFALLYDVLHDIPEPAPVLAGLYRILKPTGLLSASDHHLGENALSSTVTASGLYRFIGRNRWTTQFEKNA